MELIHCSLARCETTVESSSAEFENWGNIYCCEQHLLQHGNDVQNEARAGHLVYGKTLDNGNQCPVCKNRIKFVVYQQNTGHQQFDHCRNTSRAQAHATQLTRENPVAAQSSAVLPSSMQKFRGGTCWQYKISHFTLDLNVWNRWVCWPSISVFHWRRRYIVYFVWVEQWY